MGSNKKDKDWKRVPFAVELAKKIVNCETIGRITTVNGEPARILAFDIKWEYGPIVVVKTKEDGSECVYEVGNDGVYMEDHEFPDFDLVIERPVTKSFIKWNGVG